MLGIGLRSPIKKRFPFRRFPHSFCCRPRCKENCAGTLGIRKNSLPSPVPRPLAVKKNRRSVQPGALQERFPTDPPDGGGR